MNYRYILTMIMILTGLTCLMACSVPNTKDTDTPAEEITTTDSSGSGSDSAKADKAIFKKGDNLAPFEREQLAYATVYISDCEAGMPTQKILNEEILDAMYDAARNTVVGDLVDDMMSSDGGDIYIFYDKDDNMLSKFYYAGGDKIYQDDHRYEVENIKAIRNIPGILDYNDLLEFDYEDADNYSDGFITIE